VKLTVFEDGSDKQFLKLIKEFKNLIFTYDLWNKPDGSELLYRYFRRCIAGSARDLWDQVNKIEEDEERDELTFETHLWELTTEIIEEDAYQSQKDYLKKTHKPHKMPVKQWISRMKNINSYLPLMEQEASSLTEKELITKVITPNLPKAWLKDFKLLKLNCKAKIKEVLQELLVIEDYIKLEKKPQTHQNGPDHNKILKNPCRLHNGNHKWADCRQNPKNSNNNQQHTNGQEQKRGSNNNNNQDHNREEQRSTGNNGGRERDRTPVRNRRTVDYDNEESFCIMDKSGDQMKKKVIIRSANSYPNQQGIKKNILRTLGYSGKLHSTTAHQQKERNQSISYVQQMRRRHL
jgi:hypothetical protein